MTLPASGSVLQTNNGVLYLLVPDAKPVAITGILGNDKYSAVSLDGEKFIVDPSMAPCILWMLRGAALIIIAWLGYKLECAFKNIASNRDYQLSNAMDTAASDSMSSPPTVSMALTKSSKLLNGVSGMLLFSDDNQICRDTTITGWIPPKQTDWAGNPIVCQLGMFTGITNVYDMPDYTTITNVNMVSTNLRDWVPDEDEYITVLTMGSDKTGTNIASCTEIKFYMGSPYLTNYYRVDPTGGSYLVYASPSAFPPVSCRVGPPKFWATFPLNR
jgi:hypothetical protein